MRSTQLKAGLTAYIESAAEYLSAELAAGAEIPFELESQPHRRGGGGPSLYCYRPLIGDFLAERRGALEALPEHTEASLLLEDYEGLDRYLVAVGQDITRLTPAARLRTAIASLLAEVFDEQSDFELRPERVARALERLHSTALASTAEVTIVATLHGLTITSPELPLTTGLTIARPAALEGLPTSVQETGEDGHEHLVVALASEEHDPREALARGQEVLKDLLRALRLFGDGRVTLGALGWARIGGAQWTPLALGDGGRPHGMLVVTTEQEDELRAFCNLVSRRAPHGNELAWALRRFELGCERDDPFEALSDNLLALRALLEPEGPSSGMLAGRLAALCATPERRLALTERTVQAIALERSLIAGTARSHAGAIGLASDIADHLRALLRDVICGHLDADLVGLADELLLSVREAVTPPPATSAPAAWPAAPGPPPVPAPHGGAWPAAPATTVAQSGRRPRGVPGFAAVSEPELGGDAGEAEEILDLLI